MNISSFDRARNALVEEGLLLLPSDIEGRLVEIEHWLALIEEADSQIAEGISLARRGLQSKQSYIEGLHGVIVSSRAELATRRDEMEAAARELGYKHLPERPAPGVVVRINPEWGGDTA